MIDLPMRGFCLFGNNGEERIEITISEVYGFPETTSYAGGYEFKGSLLICTGCFRAYSENYYSTTGELYSFYSSLVKCYDSLKGRAKYCKMYEKDLEFELEMTKLGHATIIGEYTEYPHLPNKLVFQIDTDQTCIRYAIEELRQIEELYGDMKGKRM